MRVTWVTRSFLDYRVPVLAELDELLSHQLRVVFSLDRVPPRVREKIAGVLGARAIGVAGEWALGPDNGQGTANRGASVRIRPGMGRLIGSCEPDVLVGDGFFKWTFAALQYRLAHGTPLVISSPRL